MSNVLVRVRDPCGFSCSECSFSLVQDETGVCKNLLQETAQRAGVSLPVYTTTRSGPGHLPVFTCQVELAGMKFDGEAAKTKKQAEKNAAMAAWSALKQCEYHVSSISPPASRSLGVSVHSFFTPFLLSVRRGDGPPSLRHDGVRAGEIGRPRRATLGDVVRILLFVCEVGFFSWGGDLGLWHRTVGQSDERLAMI